MIFKKKTFDIQNGILDLTSHVFFIFLENRSAHLLNPMTHFELAILIMIIYQISEYPDS